MKIAILDGFCTNPGDIDWTPITSLGETIIFDRVKPDEVVEKSGDADIILVNKVVVTADAMRRMPNLKYIGILATGTNVVDLEEARKLGITVTNIPSYSTDSVAQMTFALLLALTTRPEYYSNLNHKGEWARNADFCYWHNSLVELAGKQMGLVGFGHIGRKVAEIATAFGMRVAVVTSKTQDALPRGIQKMDFPEMLRSSDVVSLHCPLTDNNFHLMGAEEFGMMKPGAIFLNTSRGKLVDENALAQALKEGKIRGAGIDVMEQEPPSEDNVLFGIENCVITPHIAWATLEARKRLLDIAAANIRSFLDGTPQNRV